jgi:lipopolysaccharide export system protein LptA
MAPPSGISIKGIGLIAAGVLALIFTAIIVVSMMVTTPNQPTDSDDFPDPDEIIDIENTQTGGAMFVTIVDQNDPTRVSSTLRAARFEPIGEGRRRLDDPESWIYLDDGRAIRVNADFATMLMPDPNQAPESGTLEGNIVIRAYDSTPAPGEPATDAQRPTLTARFDQPLEFERRYLRMRSGGRFEIESEQVDFAGEDLTVIFNDLQNRIELIDVMQGDQMVIHTSTLSDSNETQTQAQPAEPSAASQATAQGSNVDTQPAAEANTLAAEQREDEQRQPATVSTPELDEQHYHITMDADVRAEMSGSGYVLADSLELWASVIDGQIPENAIRRIALAQQSSAPPVPDSEPRTPATQQPDTDTLPISEGQSNQSIAQTETQTETQIETQAEPEDLVITWSGPMRVRPIDDELPTQLVEDRVALRLNANEGRGISMSAPDRGFSGQATRLTYFATRAIAKLDGKASDEGIIKLEVEEAGTLYSESLLADLTSGLIEMKMRGSITTSDPDPAQVASVRWKDRAEIKFAIDEQGRLTQRLEHARFEGAAIAEQDGSSVGARAINAKLDPDLPAASSLTQIILEEGVIASAEKQTLTGQTVTIDFVPASDPNDSPRPVRVSSVGSSMGRTPDQMLRAAEMHAQLVQDRSGKTLIKSAQARGGVNYRDSSRTTARADELEADGINEVITLKGKDAQVTQAGSTIGGEHITLRAKRRSVEVVGPGTFDHDIALDQAPDATPGLKGQVNARWTQSMRFEDTLGTVECRGDVRVISTPDALTRDTLKADRMTINLTPMPTSDPVGGARSPERQLISARASGRAEPGQTPVPASVESRSYSPENPELAIGVLYLEGAQILADNEKQTLVVPGAGTLLVLDREQSQQREQAAQPDRPIGGSGLTRFTWKTRMTLERLQGTGTFAGTVQVDHKSLSSNEITTLQTDTLVANFETDPTGTENAESIAGNANALTSAIARGNVRFQYEDRELVCDLAEYDAIEESLFASAVENNLVTLYNNDGSAPTSARTLLWDLKLDRFEVNAPSPIRTTPGG